MGLKQLISDTIRSIKTGQVADTGILPDVNYPGKGEKYGHWSEHPDHYTLPEHSAWVIGGRFYRNAGEAKIAAIEESKRLGN